MGEAPTAPPAEVGEALGRVMVATGQVVDRFVEYSAAVGTAEWRAYQQCLALEMGMLEEVVEKLERE